MDQSDSVPTDDSSIRPVSSLRSRFESLVREKEPPSPSIQRNHTQTQDLRPSTNHGRPWDTSSRVSLDYARPNSFIGGPDLSNDRLVHASSQQSKKRPPTPPKQRPKSMFASPKPSPPSVKVESPTSPPKHFHVNVTSATPTKSHPPTPSAPGSHTHSPVASADHSRSPSRVTTPALEARMSAFLQAAQSPETQSDTDKREPATAHKPKGNHAPPPPPVNRAGKPKLADLPPPLHIDAVNPFGSLAPLDANDRGDEKLSPFSTPPSSSDSTPAGHLPHSVSLQNRSKNSMQFPTNQGYFSQVTSQRVVPDSSRDQPPSRVTNPVGSSFEPRHQSTQPSRAKPIHQQAIISAEDDSEGSPDLPPRPGRQSRSGRTSPVRQQRIPARQSIDVERRPSVIVAETNAHFMPPPRRAQQSALMQGFDRTPTPAPIAQKLPPPAVPPARRSVDTRRDEIRLEHAVPHSTNSADDFDDPPMVSDGASLPTLADFPDASQTNRRPPQFRRGPWEISTGYETKLLAVSGQFVCTTGFITRVWDLRTGNTCLTLAHGEGVKVTALVFKPTADVDGEGQRLWLGTTEGEIDEVDIPAQSVVHTKPNAHRREIVKMYRQASQIWSLDVEGQLNVWSAGQNGMPSLDTTPKTFRTIKGHSCSLVVSGQLWLANAKDIHIFQPNARSDDAFQLLKRPLRQESAGDITSAATLSSKPGLVYFGHNDGKVSLYDTRSLECMGIVNISPYKVNSLAGAGGYLWAGFSTGMIYVYDTSATPWRVTKDWHAHDKSLSSIITDRQSLWKMDRLQVVTLGQDNTIRLWDGLLEEDWLESRMQKHDDEFCSFEEMTAAVLTWNAGAVKPSYLKNDQRDNNFFRDYLSSHNPPDIFVFGFQELVDLEDKKVTASESFCSFLYCWVV